MLFEAKWAYTRSLLPTRIRARSSTRAHEQMALQTELGFCTIQGGEAGSCHGVWGAGTLGC